MSNPIPITNDSMLLEVIGADLVLVINDVTDKILDNIKEVVLLNVYEEFPYHGDYVRLWDDGGFLGAWSKSIANFVGNEINAKVGYDWMSMDYNPDEHQHGNPYVDRRENLAHDIEFGVGYDFGGNAWTRRPFWGVVERMVEDGSFDAILESSMTAHGIVFMRG